MKGKLIIFSAPSGAGKSTIVKRLLQQLPQLAFSISATSREPRTGEQDGQHYYFLSPEEFQKEIAREAFLEWEEVYPGLYYGTLRAEVERLWEGGKQVIFDIDVVGGLNLKQQFGKNALALFVQPPSLAILEERLRNRGTESEEKLQMRLAKAEQEMATASSFDHIILNDNLEVAVNEALQLVKRFLEA